jgi:hypothetical protein
VETAAQLPGHTTGPFAGLARASGLSVRDCQLAAASGRLVDVIRVAEVRRRAPVTTAVQARLRLLELRYRLLDGR